MDADRFVEHYERLAKKLYRYALYMLGRETDAEDAVSESVLDAWRGLANLRDEAAFEPWMFGILRNKCMAKRREYARSETETVAELPEPMAEGVPTESECADTRSILQSALLTISNEDRQIILLNVLCGFGLKEIADMTGQQEATVRSRKSRALRKLREYMAS